MQTPRQTMDLHMHSSLSIDGEYAPEALMDLCAEAGLTLAALADHNTVAGVARAAGRAAELGISFLPAVELDCILDGAYLHVLGYSIDVTNARFLAIDRDMHRQLVDASGEMMDKLAALGIHFDRDKVMALSQDGAVAGERVAEVALADPRNAQNPLVTPYLPGGGRDDNPYLNFDLDYCYQGKPGYVALNYMGAEEAISLIHDAGGTAVLAHPAHNLGGKEHLLDKLAALGLDGLEVFSNYHDEEKTAFYEAAAIRLKLLKTMGSDFHGKTKPGIRLGDVGRPFPEADIRAALAACGLLT